MKIVMTRSTPIDPDVRVTKEAMSLGKQGHDITILGWNRKLRDYPRPEKHEWYDIVRVNLMAKSGMKTLFYLPLWWIFESKYLLNFKWDVVHAADFDTYLPALICAKLKHKPIIYDIYDFYADSVNLPTLVRKFIGSLDRLLMKYADSIILVDKSRISEIGIPNLKNVSFIYNVPEDLLQKTSKDEWNLHHPTKYTVFYAGAFTPYRDIESMARVAKELGGIQLELAGPLTQTTHPRDLDTHNPCVSYLGVLTPEEALHKSLNSDLLFALYDPSLPANKYASPNKLFDAMMGGIPIIVSDGTSMADIVREEKCGIVVEYGNYEQLRDSVKMLIENPEYAHELGMNGRKAFEREYNWMVMEKKLALIYIGAFR